MKAVDAFSQWYNISLRKLTAKEKKASGGSAIPNNLVEELSNFHVHQETLILW